MEKLFKILKQEKMIWVEVERKNAKEFLKTLKNLNFKWLNGKNINIDSDKPFFHLSIDSNGTLANVAMFAWFSPDSKKFKKLTFEDFKKLI